MFCVKKKYIVILDLALTCFISSLDFPTSLMKLLISQLISGDNKILSLDTSNQLAWMRLHIP